MDDMCLDPASNEPARQPKAVAASFIGQCNPTDRPPSTHRLAPPPLDQSQQCRRIRLQLLQRLALDAGNNAAHEPTRLAHLDDHHQGRDRIKHGQTSAEIIDLRHGVPPSVRMDDEGATTSAAPPHSFSYLGSKRQMLAACAPAPVTRVPGSESGACFAGSHFPWSPTFAPSTPLRLTPPRIAPQRGATLFADFPATMARSDFSCPCIIGFDSSSSRCGPSYSAPTRHRWPDPRSPSFRCDPFARDVALDPGRASAPRIAVPHMLPSSE